MVRPGQSIDRLERFKERWLGRGYLNLRAGGKAVRDTENNVRIDFLIAGDFPGDGKPKPVAIPAPASASIAGEKYRVVSMPKLIELKLAISSRANTPRASTRTSVTSSTSSGISPNKPRTSTEV